VVRLIKNPIIKGFNPDPSIIRVDNDYYIATSTFEWFPGVQIHHSKDLVHWRLLTHPITRTSQLDLRGNPSSGGVWAPNLTYKDGIFYLIYSDVKNRTGVYKDVHNYLITAENIMGPWSEPIYLNSSGFDPAFIHDDDGKTYLLNMLWNFRKDHPNFDGILLQEYDHNQQKLVGPIKKIIEGLPNWVREGSNLYKIGDYYYIVLAEGGTGYLHSATIGRSKHIEGPYEMDPQTPLLSATHEPDHPLQKAGHGSLIETQNGEWYIAYLCARPLPSKLCPLGREIAIEKCYWTDDNWLRLEGDDILPNVEVERPNLPLHPFEEPPAKDDFDNDTLNIHFSTLRVPSSESWLSLKERPGYLRVSGRESLTSLNNQSMVARRIQDYYCDVETCIEFEPENFMQMAGLICYYDERDHFYLRISYHEKLGKNISIMTMDNGHYDELTEDVVSIEGWERCYLKVSIRYETFEFYYSQDGETWHQIGPAFSLGNLSDEYEGKLGFTGAFAGMCVQDLSGQKKHADFDYFTYHVVDSE